jgi:hypothetical protein
MYRLTLFFTGSRLDVIQEPCRARLRRTAERKAKQSPGTGGLMVTCPLVESSGGSSAGLNGTVESDCDGSGIVDKTERLGDAEGR